MSCTVQSNRQAVQAGAAHLQSDPDAAGSRWRNNGRRPGGSASASASSRCPCCWWHHIARLRYRPARDAAGGAARHSCCRGLCGAVSHCWLQLLRGQGHLRCHLGVVTALRLLVLGLTHGRCLPAAASLQAQGHRVRSEGPPVAAVCACEERPLRACHSMPSAGHAVSVAYLQG